MERGPTPCICGDALHEPTRLARTRANVHEPWGWTPWNAVRRNACAATGIKGQCPRRVECDGTRCNSMCSETLQEVSLLCHRRWGRNALERDPMRCTSRRLLGQGPIRTDGGRSAMTSSTSNSSITRAGSHGREYCEIMPRHPAAESSTGVRMGMFQRLALVPSERGLDDRLQIR